MGSAVTTIGQPDVSGYNNNDNLAVQLEDNILGSIDDVPGPDNQSPPQLVPQCQQSSHVRIPTEKAHNGDTTHQSQLATAVVEACLNAEQVREEHTTWLCHIQELHSDVLLADWAPTRTEAI